MTVYKIEKFDFREIDQLSPLMYDCFGMQFDPAYFIWKYLDNPLPGSVGFVAKDENNRIVAFEGLMPESYSIHSENRIIYHSTDTMTHSQHRRKGLYQKIACAGFEYLKQQNNLFEFGFGGPMSTPLILKLGWKTLFEVPFYFKTSLQSIINVSFNYKLRKKADFLVREINSTDEVIPLIQKNQNTGIYKIITKGILEWKISNPRFNYRKFGIFNGENSLAAYVIYYIQNNKIMLFDFDISDSDRKIEQILFTWLDGLVMKNRYSGIITFAQQDIIFSRILKRNGYITNKMGLGPLKHKLPFMVFTDDITFGSINNQKYWAIKPICHDSF